MKKVRIMLSAICILAIVAGALAFKVKSPDVCAYERLLSNGPVATKCPFFGVGNYYTTTQGAAVNQYATTVPKPSVGDCPAEIICNRAKQLLVEE
ncbi:hypothetical protein [Paraflavitalea soli]|nr:hypothetical protein [Paraflavitalea soli]